MERYEVTEDSAKLLTLAVEQVTFDLPEGV